MKWLGQYIQHFTSRFRNDVYLEDLHTTTNTNVLVVDANGLISKSTTLADDIIEAEIDTLPALTSFGAVGATTNVLAGDLTMYNAVNDGNPTLSIGSSAANRLEIASVYNSGAQGLCDVNFTTYTDSGTANDGRFNWYVDEVLLGILHDSGLSIRGEIQSLVNNATLTAIDTIASSATKGGRIVLVSDDDAAMGDNHRLGAIEFYGAEDAGSGAGSNTHSIGARIQAIARDAWDGSNNDADLEFYTTDGTSESKVLTLDADKLATFRGGVTAIGTLKAGNSGIAITNTTTSSATQGGRLRLIADDDAVLADNHRLGVIEFQSREVGNGAIGYSATGNIQTGARIQAIADATWSTTENGTSLEFYTTDGNASEGLALTLDSNKLASFAGDVMVEGDLTVNGDTTTFSSANADDPTVIIKNTTADAQGARLQMKKDRGAAMVQGDRVGEIDFIGEDASQNFQQYGKILVRADVVTAGEESGAMMFQVANHDGGLENGFILEGGSEDGEIDVTIGLGANSVVTIPGDIDLAGDIDVDGTLETDALTIGGTTIAAIGTSSITTLGTIGTGIWNGNVIGSAYLDPDTAHLSGAQTFTGTKTLNSFKGTAGATVTNILDEDAMGSDSATALATQQSIKAYSDRPKKQIQIYNANFKGNVGTTETFIPLAGVPDENADGSREQIPLIMPCAGKVKEIILRMHWNSTITTSDDITWKVYNRPKNKMMNGESLIGSAFTMVNPTQADGDANNTRTSGEISYAFDEYDAIAISMQWAATGPTAGADRIYVTVVVEHDLSGIGY